MPSGPRPSSTIFLAVKGAKHKKKKKLAIHGTQTTVVLLYSSIPYEPSRPVASLLSARTRIYLFLRVLAARERLTRPDTNQQTNQPTVFVFFSVSSSSSIVAGVARKRRDRKMRYHRAASQKENTRYKHPPPLGRKRPYCLSYSRCEIDSLTGVSHFRTLPSLKKAKNEKQCNSTCLFIVPTVVTVKSSSIDRLLRAW